MTGPQRIHPEPTQEALRDVLDYDQDSGVFTRRKTGKPSGVANAYGYIHIGVGDHVYRAHRLAFIWMTGACPACVDHIDGDRSNNAWRNLREATQEQNLANMRVEKGYKRKGNRWHARISIKNKTVHIGSFCTEEEARAAYVREARRLRGEFAGV